MTARCACGAGCDDGICTAQERGEHPAAPTALPRDEWPSATVDDRRTKNARLRAERDAAESGMMPPGGWPASAGLTCLCDPHASGHPFQPHHVNGWKHSTLDYLIGRVLSAEQEGDATLAGIQGDDITEARDAIADSGRTDDGALRAYDLLHLAATFGRPW